MFAVILSLVLQYFVLPSDKIYWDKLDYAWDCSDYDDQYLDECRGVSSVLRVSFSAACFFLMATIMSFLSDGFGRSFWFIKFVAFIALVITTMFLPSEIFDHGYLQFARVASTIFIVLQQIILIDIAYSWNDAWVANADEADKEEADSGGIWLNALIGISVGIFLASYTALGFLFHYFGGCSTNDTFLWLTLLLTLAAAGIQLSGDEGSLLTTAIMTAYAVYLAYSAVSSNPDDTCNPMLGQANVLEVCLGLGFVVASMAWTCFSASNNITGLMTTPGGEGNENLIEEGGKPVTGVVTGENQTKYGATSADPDQPKERANSGNDLSNSVRNSITDSSGQGWKLNLVLLLLSCWYGMVLTSWGSVTNAGSAANPAVGGVAMWMCIVAQWVALILYCWTLLAPRLFPDRDFS